MYLRKSSRIYVCLPVVNFAYFAIYFWVLLIICSKCQKIKIAKFYRFVGKVRYSRINGGARFLLIFILTFDFGYFGLG